MARMHFVTAHFGGEIPWFHQLQSEKHQISFNYYHDGNFPSRHLSMHPRLKAKIPKMLEWKYVDSDWYVWMDSSVKLLDKDPVDKILEALQNKPLCLFRHSYGGSIKFEARRVLKSLELKHSYTQNRYLGEPIKQQLLHYLGDIDFVDTNLFAMTFFVYHKSVADLMQKWFLENILWTIEDQISFPYVLHKSGLEFSLFDGFIDDKRGNNLFEWDWKSREKSLLTK